MTGTGTDLAVYDADFFSKGAEEAAYLAARVVLEQVKKHTTILSVIDFGCATGPWLMAAKDLGAVRVLGLDVDTVPRDRLLIEQSEFDPTDLATVDVKPLGTFDLAISLEVAEHLSPLVAAKHVADLCAVAPVVLFGAAVPGQGGVGHVNEQWSDYWTRGFWKHGYTCRDVLRKAIWTRVPAAPWYAQNSYLFTWGSTYWAPTFVPHPLLRSKQ